MDKKELAIEKRRIMNMSEKRKEAYSFFEEALVKNYFVDDRSFFIKIPFFSHTVEVIALFESELKSDFYVELYNKELIPLSKTRTLYKWNHHIHLEEYQSMEETEKVSKRYLIPVKELIEVSIYVGEDFSEEIDDDFYAGEDLPIKENETNTIINSDVKVSEMTALDMYAIIHKKPISKNEKINNLIKKYE